MSAAAAGQTLFEADHDDFRESVRRYLEGEAVPAREDWMRDGVPADQFAALAELGFVGIAAPEDQGGLGITDPRFGAVVIEEVMRAGLGALAPMICAHELCVEALAAAAGEAPELADLASGATVGAWTDQAGELSPAGELVGDAAGVVNAGYGGLVVGIASHEGDAVVALDGSAAVASPSPELVGPKGIDRADLLFDRIAVHLLEGVSADELRTRERLMLAVAAVAGAQTALKVTHDYVGERRAFGQLISSFENTRVALADCAAEIDAAQALTYRCLAELTEGHVASAPVAAAKLCAARALAHTADTGLQLHGGYGYMYDYEIAHQYGAAQYLRQHGGDERALRATIAATFTIA